MTASHRSSDVLQRASHDRLAHALAQQGCDQHISYGVEYDPIVTCASAGAREKLSPITLLYLQSSKQACGYAFGGLRLAFHTKPARHSP